MEADGDLVEPFDPGAEPAPEADQMNAQPDAPPPPPIDGGGGDDLSQPFDPSMDDTGGFDDGMQDDQQQDQQPQDQSLSNKANAVLNQSLYQKLVNRNKEIEDTLENIQTITPVLPREIIDENDISINRLKAALEKGQSYALEKFVESKYGENLLFYQKLDALYVLLLNEINKNLKKVKL
jgi:hypothetical protein